MTNSPSSAAAYATFDQVFESFRYPAGESHVRVREHTGIAALQVIEATASSFDDLGQVITANHIIEFNGGAVQWYLPYFPFARHDRRNDAVDGFELQVAMQMVSELDVVIADPHSDVSGQLRHFPQRQVVALFEESGAFDNNPIVVIPDIGAAKKAQTWAAGRTTVQALKHRDPATGKLSGFQVMADDLGRRPCIIVDDICDGGGTFLGLAAELKAKNAGPLTLAVTHGLFTKGLEALGEAFDTIVSFHPTGSEQRTANAIEFKDLFIKGTAQ